MNEAYDNALRGLERFQIRARKYTIAAAVAVILGAALTVTTGVEVFVWIAIGLGISWCLVAVVTVTVLSRRAFREIDRHYAALAAEDEREGDA